MRKLFTFIAAALLSTSLFAAYAPFIPTTVYTVGDAATLGANWVDKKQDANYFVDEDAVVFNPYVCYSSASNSYQTWTGHRESNGSTATTWTAVDCFKGSTAWYKEGTQSSDIKSATTHSGRIYLYNITNCIEVKALVNPNGNSRTITVNAYEIEGGEVSTEVAKYATYSTNEIGILDLTGLDATKTYRIEILTNSGSNSYFYEIAFIKPAEVTYTVTYKANNGTEEADIVDDAASKVAACTFTAPEGKKFANWNTDASGNGDEYAVKDIVESDLTLYAQWVDICYETIYSLVGGVGSAAVTAATATVDENGLSMSDTNGRITLTAKSGAVFKNGDIIEFSGTVGNASKQFGVKIGSQTIQTTDVTYNDPDNAMAGGTAATSGVLSLAEDAATIAIGRAGGTTTTLKTCVIKREVDCTATAIDNANAGEKAIKTIENGQLVIKRDGKTFNVLGTVVK